MTSPNDSPNYEQHEGIRLNIDNIQKKENILYVCENKGQRTVAKLMLNARWEKINTTVDDLIRTLETICIFIRKKMDALLFTKEQTQIMNQPSSSTEDYFKKKTCCIPF